MSLVNKERNEFDCCFFKEGKSEVSKIPVLLRFQRNCLQRICAGAGSPSNAGKPLRSSFLSLYLPLNALLFLPLSPSFSLSLLVIPDVAYKVTMFILQESISEWALVSFFFLCISDICLSILGSPFSTPPHKESPHQEAFWLNPWLHWNIRLPKNGWQKRPHQEFPNTTLSKS